MNALEPDSSPDLNGAKNAIVFTPTGAADPFVMENVRKLPEFSFQEYLKFVEPLGRWIEGKTGVYYMVPMVQSAHESRNGNSGLAKNHGNLFGIVATASWKKAGNAICNLPTWEVIKGQKVDMKREFRAYASWRDSFQDWGRLISTAPAYAKAYPLLKDRATVARGIEIMGGVYATDPAYAKKLRAIFESVI